MWDNAIIFGVEAFVFMLLYASFKLNKDSMRYLGIFMFFTALYMQQWGFVLMIDIATEAGKTGIATSLGKLYSSYPTLLYFALLYYILMIFIDMFEMYSGTNVAEIIKGKIRKEAEPWDQGE